MLARARITLFHLRRIQFQMRLSVRVLSLILFAIVTLLCGCEGGKERRAVTVQTGGSPRRGRALIAEYKCGSCHVIPGIRHATGNFGPPLIAMSRRSYIAGEFPNEPSNLVHWIESPTSMKPKTTMPDLGLTQTQATDVAAYLQTLR